MVFLVTTGLGNAKPAVSSNNENKSEKIFAKMKIWIVKRLSCLMDTVTVNSNSLICLSNNEVMSKSKLMFPKLTEHYEFLATRRKLPSLQYYLKQRIFDRARDLKGGTREEQLMYLGLGKQFAYSPFLLK